MQCRAVPHENERNADPSCGAQQFRDSGDRRYRQVPSWRASWKRLRLFLRCVILATPREVFPWYYSVNVPTRRQLPLPGALKGGRAMDEFAYFHWTDITTLIPVALFIMLWVGGLVAIDRWVGSRRPDLQRRSHRPSGSSWG